MVTGSLGATVGCGLMDGAAYAVAAGDLVPVGRGCATPEAHAARLAAASVVTIPNVALWTTTNLPLRWRKGRAVGTDTTCEPDFQIRPSIAWKHALLDLGWPEGGDGSPCESDTWLLGLNSSRYT